MNLKTKGATTRIAITLLVTILVTSVPTVNLQAQVVRQNDQPATRQPCECPRQALTQQEIEAEYQRIIAELQATNPPELQQRVAELEAFSVGRTDEEIIGESQRQIIVAVEQAEAQAQAQWEETLERAEREPPSPLLLQTFECVQCRRNAEQNCISSRRVANLAAGGLGIIGAIGCVGLTRGQIIICAGLASIGVGLLLRSNQLAYDQCWRNVPFVCAQYCGGIVPLTPTPTPERR